MTEEIKIFRSVTEPENKNHIWMKSIRSGGYELLYYSADGWRNLITNEKASFLKDTIDECNCCID